MLRFLHFVQRSVGSREKLIESLAPAPVDGDPIADRKGRISPVVGESFHDAPGEALRAFCICIGEDYGKFIASVAHGHVDRAALKPNCICQTAERLVARNVTVSIVNFLQSIEVQ